LNIFFRPHFNIGMGLDINLFREDKGGDPNKIKESVKKR